MGNFSCTSSAGFSLIEVLVASSIGAVIGALTLQGIGLASTLQARAIEKTEATQWVRDQLEDLRLQSSNLPFNADFCQSTAADRSFAAALRDQLAASPDFATVDLPLQTKQSQSGRTLQLIRTAWIEESSVPYNILSLRYEVRAKDSARPLYHFYTEAIPDAAFQCQ